MIVLDDHARMVEIVQMKWMISAVTVSPDRQAKIVQSVKKKYIYYWLLEAFPTRSSLFTCFLFCSFYCFLLLLHFFNKFYYTFPYLIFCVQLPKTTIGSLY